MRRGHVLGVECTPPPSRQPLNHFEIADDYEGHRSPSFFKCYGIFAGLRAEFAGRICEPILRAEGAIRSYRPITMTV
jgi:hypothetical protein